VNDGYSVKMILTEWGSLLDNTRNLIRKLELSNNIEWIKRLPLPLMPTYYNSSDIICDRFGLHELGLTSLEAMACMKPIVTGYVNKERGKVYRNLPPLPNITSVKDITNEFHILLNDDELRKIKGEMNYKWVLDEHSEEKILKGLLQVYNEI